MDRRLFYMFLTLVAFTCVILIFTCCFVLESPAIVPFVILAMIASICWFILFYGEE